MNKSSAVAEMGDRGHIDMGRKKGRLLCPFRGELEPRLIQCGLGRGLLPYQVRLHPSNRLATIDMNRKLGFVPLLGELRPHLTQRRLGRRLPPYQSGILIHPAVWPQ